MNILMIGADLIEIFQSATIDPLAMKLYST